MERTLLLHTQNGRNNSSCLSVWYAPRRQLQPRAFTHACQSSIKNGCSALFWLVYAQVHTGMHRYTGVQVCTGTVYRCTGMHRYLVIENDESIASEEGEQPSVAHEIREPLKSPGVQKRATCEEFTYTHCDL